MRLRIVRPPPPEIEGLQVGHLRFGASYEIAHPLCELLLLMGYGVPVDELPHSTAAEKPITPKRSTPTHPRPSRTR